LFSIHLSPEHAPSLRQAGATNEPTCILYLGAAILPKNASKCVHHSIRISFLLDTESFPKISNALMSFAQESSNLPNQENASTSLDPQAAHFLPPPPLPSSTAPLPQYVPPIADYIRPPAPLADPFFAPQTHQVPFYPDVEIQMKKEAVHKGPNVQWKHCVKGTLDHLRYSSLPLVQFARFMNRASHSRWHLTRTTEGLNRRFHDLIRVAGNNN
jgi:hypothetical protein